MRNYILTDATGLVGRSVLRRLLDQDEDAVVHVLVEARARKNFFRTIADWDGAERVVAVIGDLRDDDAEFDDLPPSARHLVHVGLSRYAIGSDAADAVTETVNAVALAKRTGAMFHHLSTVAVAGDHTGAYSEADFDLGQRLPTSYQRAAFDAERLVRDSSDMQWRIYRASVIVGDSRTGEMDRVEGLYNVFGAVSRLATLPGTLPIALPNLGTTNIVPVDYVAAAIVELVLCDGRSGDTFHLVNRKPQPLHQVYGALATAAGAPATTVPVPRAQALRGVPGLAAAKRFALQRLGIPRAAIDDITFTAAFSSTTTHTALRRDRSISVPDFAGYAGTLWRYWAEELDPGRLRRTAGPDGFRNRVVVITGASSGIGLATAHAVAARGATVVMVARGAAELDAAVAAVRADGGDAYGYTCDVTDHEAVASLVKTTLNEHGHVDYLVNNAGRSIRRAVVSSTERMHDFERTMAVNYFGAVRLVLALLPSMRERGFGHVVNISSIGVQTKAPLFSAYVASKSALDAFSTIAAVENMDAGITFTSIRMPLVRTPMIAPTAAYATLPVDSPADAAARVVRALEDRPDRIDTPVGTLAEYVGYVAPGIRKAILHQVYRAFPESSAAKGEAAERKPSSPSLASKMLAPLMAMPTPGVGVAKWIPGLYW